MKPFEAGTIYFGKRNAHPETFLVRCTRRAEKSVWFEHVTDPARYPAGRSRVESWIDGSESAIWRYWFISSTQTAQTITPDQ